MCVSGFVSWKKFEELGEGEEMLLVDLVVR